MEDSGQGGGAAALAMTIARAAAAAQFAIRQYSFFALAKTASSARVVSLELRRERGGRGRKENT